MKSEKDYLLDESMSILSVNDTVYTNNQSFNINDCKFFIVKMKKRR